MARRTKLYTVAGDSKKNRDVGKTFLITEMAAAQAEAFAIRALLALAAAGIEVPDETQGIAGLAAAGYEALKHLKYTDLKPLLDEMFTCVQYQHKPNHPPVPVDDANIEEVSTLLTLRKEIFKVHTDF